MQSEATRNKLAALQVVAAAALVVVVGLIGLEYQRLVYDGRVCSNQISEIRENHARMHQKLVRAETRLNVLWSKHSQAVGE